MTVQEIIDLITAEVPGAPWEGSVDTVKTGDPKQPVQGIVTTFLATIPVIRRAVDMGANFIITHEPTFYNHPDATDWLDGDQVYETKRDLIARHNLVIWRFHDYWHTYQPDGIFTGVIKALDWEDRFDFDTLIATLPNTSLAGLVDIIKSRLGIEKLRVVGDPELPCRRVGLLVGAPGGRKQIEFLSQSDVDVLVCGEINEWETSEYVRDAIDSGRQIALIITGHANSEEAGMAWLVDWLRQRVPDVPITHIPAGDPFMVM